MSFCKSTVQKPMVITGRKLKCYSQFTIPCNVTNKTEDEKQISCDCVIEVLMKNSNNLTFGEKLKIIQNGPPKPDFSTIIQDHVKILSLKCEIEYYTELYDRTAWMCGCKKYKKLFCWPCILFSKENHVWKSGFHDFRNLKKAESYHRVSCVHISCSKELKLFGKSNELIGYKLSENYITNTRQYNQLVVHNRNILSYLITAVCFLSSQGLNFNESEDKDNGDSKNSIIKPNNYFNLINLFAEFNSDLKTHIRAVNKFDIFSPNLCNDLIFCISEVMMQEIKKEIDQTSFLTLILNKVIDLDLAAWLSIVFRYVDGNGEIKERLLYFIDIKSNYLLDSLSKSIINIIEEFNCSTKLIAYNFDGAIIRIDEQANLEKIIKSQCEQALFINSSANTLDTVLSQSVSFLKEAKIFFASLSTFGNFFASSSKRKETLYAELTKTITPNQWTHQSSLIKILHDNRTSFENVFLSIMYEPIKWDFGSISLAYNMYSMLKDFYFNFFLEVFYRTLPVAHNLFRLMQKHILIDINYCLKKLDEFKVYLFSLQNDFDGFWKIVCDDYLKHLDYDKNSTKVVEDVMTNDRKELCSRSFKEIIDVLTSNLIIRYENLSKLQFCNLLDHKKFRQFKKRFPEEALSCLNHTYGRFFDLNSLKNELTVLYSEQDITEENIVNLHDYLIKLDLSTVFPETNKLCELILTLPIINLKEKSFSALTRINNFLNTNKLRYHTLSSSTALLNIENSYLKKLICNKEFVDNVISIFATKNYGLELLYKD